MNHIKHSLTLFFLLFSIYLSAATENNDLPYFCRIKEFSAADGLTQEHIVDFAQDHQGFIWFGTWNGLVRYDGYRFHTFKPSKSPIWSNRIISMRLYSDGNIWCTTYDNRLHIFDTKRCTFSQNIDVKKEKGWERRPGMTKIQHHTPDINYHDHYGNIIKWYSGHLLTCRNPQNNHSFSIPIYDERGKTDYNPEIQNYAIDSQNNLWLIMSHKLARITFYPNWFHHHPNGSGTETRALFIDNNQRLWIGCKDGTLRIWNKSQTAFVYLTSNGKVTSSKHIFSKKNVYTIYKDHLKRLWIGTKGDGIYCLTPSNKNITQFNVHHFVHNDMNKNSISSDEIYAITEDNQAHIWIGTWGNGVNIVNENNGISFTNRNNTMKGYLSDNCLKVRCLYCTPDGTMFIGTAGGLVTIHGKTILHSLPGTDVMQIISANNKIYLCLYAKGISEITSIDFSTGKINLKNFDADNNANDCYINAVYDKHQSIWLLSESSLMRFNIRSHRFSIYDEENFGERYFFSEAKAVTDTDGTIILGTENGIFSFNPETIKYWNKAPYIVITGLQYQGENFIHPTNDIDRINLTPQQRSLTIFLATPNLNEIAKTSFAYKLEGYDKSWNYIINGHSISYGNLPPGKYLLKICVSNAEGKWKNDMRTIRVFVKPLFTETIWFLMIILILVITTIITVIYITYYIKRLRTRQHQLLQYIEQNMHKKDTDNSSGDNVPLSRVPAFTPPSLHDKDKDFLDKFTEIFLTNICNNDMSIDDFATSLNMSHAVFYRKVKQLVGVTPVDFIRRLRIRRATQYFDSGERQIADIAYKTGFSDPKYFSRCFKTETGYSPSEYCQHLDEN